MGHLCVLRMSCWLNRSLKGLRREVSFNTSLYRGGCGLPRSPTPPTGALPLCASPATTLYAECGSTWSIPSRPLPTPAAPSSLATGAVPPGQGPPTPTSASCPPSSAPQHNPLTSSWATLEWKYDQSDVADLWPHVAHPPHFPLPSLFNDRTLSGFMLGGMGSCCPGG